MNEIHAAFASEPAIEMTLEKLFAVLDRIEAQQRYEYLSPVIQDVLMKLEWQAAGPTYDAAYQEIYEAFKAKCFQVGGQVVTSQFFAYSIVSRTLSWLCVSSSEHHIEQAIQHNRAQIEEAENSLAVGRITKDEHDAVVRDCEERINNLPSDLELMKKRYASFCQTVVRQFLSYAPGEE